MGTVRESLDVESDEPTSMDDTESREPVDDEDKGLGSGL